MFSIDTNKYRIVDLSYTVDPDNYPPDRPFALELGYLADRAFKYDVRTHSHVGTHIEAPAHFYEGGRDITSYPLDAFFGGRCSSTSRTPKRRPRCPPPSSTA